MSDCKEFQGILLVDLVSKVDFVRGYVMGCEIVMGVPCPLKGHSPKH